MNQSNSQPLHTTENIDEDVLDLASYINFIIDSRWMIARIALVIILFGLMYAWMAVPIYQSNILIQVEDSATSSKNILGDMSSMFDIKTEASAEMEVLRSRFVVMRTVSNGHLNISVKPKYFPVIGAWIARRSKKLSNPGLLGFGGYVWGSEHASVSVFNVSDQLENSQFVLTALSNAKFSLTQDDVDINIIGQVGVPFKIQTAEGEIELLVAQLMAKPGAQFILKRAPTLTTVENLQKALKIAERGKQSGIIGVELEDVDAKKAANILNEIGREYIRQNVERKAEEAEKSLIFLDKELPNLKLQLERSEEKYTALRNNRGSIDLGEEAKAVLLQSTQTQIKLVELKQRRDELLVRFQDRNPMVQAVNQQISSLKEELGNIDHKIKQMPQTEQDMFRLARDVKVNTDLYISLLNSAQQLQLIKASKIGNARLLDSAVASIDPVRPNRLQVIFISILLGILAGIVVAILRKILFGGLDDPNDIEQKFGLKVSAIIPHSELQDKLNSEMAGRSIELSVLVHVKPSDPVVESLRSLRTSLQFSMLDAKNNIVIITGPTPGVGKSFVSINFASVLALTGKKILLIDGDLRKGHLHRYLGLERGQGLSEVISGKITLDQIIKKNVVENVDFISTGTFPARPAELLGSQNFINILEELSAVYDMVLIDTAPILAVTDALIIAAHAGTIYNVVRGGKSTMGEISETGKRIKQTGSNITGIVFNDLKIKIGSYNYISKYSKYRYSEYKY